MYYHRVTDEVGEEYKGRHGCLCLRRQKIFTGVTPEQDFPRQLEVVHRDNRTVYVFWLHASILILDLTPGSSSWIHWRTVLAILITSSRKMVSVCTKIPDPLSPHLLLQRKHLLSGQRTESLWVTNHNILIRQMYTPFPDSAMVFCSPGPKFIFFSRSSWNPRSNTSPCTTTVYTPPNLSTAMIPDFLPIHLHSESESVSHSVESNSFWPHGLHQAPLFMGFSRQEFPGNLPFPSPGDLPNPGIENRSPALQANSLLSELPGKPNEWSSNSGLSLSLSLLPLPFLSCILTSLPNLAFSSWLFSYVLFLDCIWPWLHWASTKKPKFRLLIVSPNLITFIDPEVL